MRFRVAQISDLPEIMEIITEAQASLRLAQIDQWQNGYPNAKIIAQDIQSGNSYALIKDDRVVATAVLEFGGDPNYVIIHEGTWITDGSYGAIHRIAVAEDYKGSGLASQMIEALEGLCQEQKVRSLRVDTHKDNKPMQRMLQKNGFQYCGIIFLADGSPRVAFEKVISNI